MADHKFINILIIFNYWPNSIGENVRILIGLKATNLMTL